MILPLAKLGIVVGAGIVGSVLTKEGGRSTISDVVSGTFRVLRRISRDDSAPSSSTPRNDSLLAQVNSLRQELQLLASNGSVTIVTSTGSGSGKYGIVIITIVVGSGYVWWKGWKLPDMMFATKRSLADACNSVAVQLENVYSSLKETRRDLSSRIKSVDHTIDKCAKITADTGMKVSKLKEDIEVIDGTVKSVTHVVKSLENKFKSIEMKQISTNDGVEKLVDYAWTLENGRNIEQIQTASSTPALELPQHTAISRIGSLPPVPVVEPPSPSASSEFRKKHLKTTSSPSTWGLKNFGGISEPEEAMSSPDVSRTEEEANVVGSSSGSRMLSRRLSASFFTRTHTVVLPSK